MDYAIKVTGAERGFLLLYDDKSSQLNLNVSHGLTQEALSQTFSFENYKISLELIKESEKAEFLLMKLNIVMVNDACNPPHCFLPPIGEEKYHLGMGTKGGFEIEFLELVFDEGGTQ
jgi:hypothetical protein